MKEKCNALKKLKNAIKTIGNKVNSCLEYKNKAALLDVELAIKTAVVKKTTCSWPYNRYCVSSAGFHPDKGTDAFAEGNCDDKCATGKEGCQLDGAPDRSSGVIHCCCDKKNCNGADKLGEQVRKETGDVVSYCLRYGGGDSTLVTGRDFGRSIDKVQSPQSKKCEWPLLVDCFNGAGWNAKDGSRTVGGCASMELCKRLGTQMNDCVHKELEGKITVYCCCDDQRCNTPDKLRDKLGLSQVPQLDPEDKTPEEDEEGGGGEEEGGGEGGGEAGEGGEGEKEEEEEEEEEKEDGDELEQSETTVEGQGTASTTAASGWCRRTPRLLLPLLPAVATAGLLALLW